MKVLGAIHPVLVRLGSEDSRVRALALHVLGTAASNNPPFQLDLLEAAPDIFLTLLKVGLRGWEFHSKQRKRTDENGGLRLLQWSYFGLLHIIQISFPSEYMGCQAKTKKDSEQSLCCLSISSLAVVLSLRTWLDSIIVLSLPCLCYTFPTCDHYFAFLRPLPHSSWMTLMRS